MLNELNITSKLDSNTLLITGEGALDNTSFQGKIIGYLLEITKKHQTDTIIICGINKTNNISNKVYPLHDKLVPNYQETVYQDVERTFNKILKDNFLDFVDLKFEMFDELPNDIFELRKEVFVGEQGIPEELEFDQYDNTSKHIGVYLDNNLIGTIRLIEMDLCSCKIGRFVVKTSFRGFGIGKYIISYVLDNTKYNYFLVHAQVDKIGFYEKSGFQTFGEVFIEDGIEHIKMYKRR